MLSLCVDRGSAATELQIGQGDLVVLSRSSDSAAQTNVSVTTAVKISPTR
jgi:hypothetical protein